MSAGKHRIIRNTRLTDKGRRGKEGVKESEKSCDVIDDRPLRPFNDQISDQIGGLAFLGDGIDSGAEKHALDTLSRATTTRQSASGVGGRKRKRRDREEGRRTRERERRRARAAPREGARGRATKTLCAYDKQNRFPDIT